MYSILDDKVYHPMITVMVNMLHAKFVKLSLFYHWGVIGYLLKELNILYVLTTLTL